MISDDAIRAEIAGAFQPFELFMPAPACIETSTLHWANVSPRNISTNRQDIRLNRVRRILDYYAANGRLSGTKLRGVYVNKVNGKFQVGIDGNHRVVAARVLNLSRIRVRVEVPDYELAIVKYVAIRLREKWYVSSSVNFERGVVDVSFPLHDFPEMPARLEALGFTLHIIS